MANLIITIISIGLFAVAAISVIYYGGQAFQNGQINATATAIINESQQILAAERLWATNNNQPDVSGMPNGTTGNGVTVLINNNSGMSLLLSSKAFSTWPSFAGSVGGPTVTNITSFQGGPAPSSGSVTTGSYDNGCYNIGGYYGQMQRQIFSYRGGNYVTYIFGINDPPVGGSCATVSATFFSTSTTDVTRAYHPIVKIANAINAQINQIASNAVPTSLGVPLAPAASSYPLGGGTGTSQAPLDSNGAVLTNYCFLAGVTGPYNPNARLIECTFGPS